MDELFQKCLFEGDEKETVLRAIRIVQPDYQLPPAPKPQTCKSALLNGFYSKVSRRVGVEVLELATRRSHVPRVRSGPAQDCGSHRLTLVAGEGGVLPQAGFLCAGAAGALPAAAGDGAEQHHHHPVGGVDQTADPAGPQSGKLGVPGAACRGLGAVQCSGLAWPHGVL